MKFYGRFGGEIYQDHVYPDSLPCDPRDKRSCIVDSYPGETVEARKTRILDVVTTFLLQVKRIQANDLLSWREVTQLVLNEPEHLVVKNLTLSKVAPELEYWTREGRISKIIIKKPEEPDHFDNLNYWTVYLSYDGFHGNWKVTNVYDLLDDDRYLVAWYALWRKWPIQYKAWEWAGRSKEVRNALKGPNYCDYFKNLYNKEIEDGKLVLSTDYHLWTWQLFHICQWDDFDSYHRDPCKMISEFYKNPRSEDPEKQKRMENELERIRKGVNFVF